MSDFEQEEYEDLAVRLERLEQATENLYAAEPEDEWTAERIVAEAQQDGRAVRQRLAAIAAETQQAVFDRARQDPTLHAATQAEPINQALEIVAKASPDFHENAPRVQEYLAQHQDEFTPVLMSGDPFKISQAIFTAHMAVKAADTNSELGRRAKEAAQTMSGSNSIRPTKSAWDAIMAARPNVRIGD